MTEVDDAARLGVWALAGLVAGAHEGVAIYDAARRFVYANAAACEILGLSLDELRGRDYLERIPPRERGFVLARASGLPGRPLGGSELFVYTVSRPDGTEREIVSYSFPIDIDGVPHGAAIFRDVTAARAAGRAGTALAQVTAQLVGSEHTDVVLAGIARHAVEGTRAVASGILTVGGDHKLASGGGYARGGVLGTARGETRDAPWAALSDAVGEEVVIAMTGGQIRIGDVPGQPVVPPDARSAWKASPVIGALAATLEQLGWQAGVYLPLSWEDRVFGLFGVYLPAGLAGPSEEELAFYSALADQAAVAMTNARLASEAKEAAAFLERDRLARELHDSVSQALFSMTMHARAAQLAMVKAGVDEGGPLGRSIAQLAELTKGALAEMRALIFEMRPGALAEEGLVAALDKQAAALSARDELRVTVEGPKPRLELAPEVEEHLYRIASEALHNVAKHARADRATVTVSVEAGVVRIAVFDDGAGFDPSTPRPGHLGLSTMAERARLIGAELSVRSAPGTGTTVTVSRPADRPEQAEATAGGSPEAAAGGC